MPSMDPGEFAALAHELSRAGTPEQTAHHVVDQALSALGADHASITLIRSQGRLETIAPSDDVAVKADVLQYELSEGPCRDSSWHGQTLVSEDLDSDPRWPNWAPRAAALGIASVLAAELSAADTGTRLGALNLYWTRPAAVTSDDVAYVSIFAVHAAVALATSLHSAQLNTALDARNIIGQAQGILMERHHLSPEQAFEVLRRYSQNHNLKLRDVAQQVADTRQLPH